MPIGLSKAPNTLPQAAKQLWIDTFNGAFENSCEGSEAEKDECAAKIAWSRVRKEYRKVNDKWVARKSEAYHDILLTITKASLQPDGSVRWQAVASDTGKDKAHEQTSIELFQDWIDRVTYKSSVPFLPEPKMPFLGVSHYPALDGFGEAGITYRMYIDGNTFKADGVFKNNSPVGQKLLDAVKAELTLIKKGEALEKPIRISAGWWDLMHYHKESNYLFVRQALTDKCPLCEKKQTTDKVYKAGQLDHFAATRVPMNPRTSLGLEEKSMAKKITRKEDAESIIGADAAEEMERLARMVGKSETENELPEGMVVKAGTKIGNFIRRKREEMEMSIKDLADKTDVTESTIGDIENGVIKTPSEPVIGQIARALEESEESLLNMLPANAKPADKIQNNKATIKTESLDITDEQKGQIAEMVADVLTPTDGNEGQPVKKMDGEAEAVMVSLPLGGATSLGEAEAFIETQEKMHQLHSHWDLFQIVVRNILRDDEVDDKVVAMSQAVEDLGQRIDTLKAGLADAFLIQESTAAYQEADIILEDEDDIMSNPQTQPPVIEHPADQLKAAVDVALANKSFGRPDQEKAIQEAFNTYAQSVQAQLDQANPLPPAQQIADAIKAGLADVLTPLTEQVGLLTAKINNQQAQPQPVTPQPVQVPQQKSMVMPAQSPQPVTPNGSQSHHVSPVTGQPSQLTDIIRKSVGLVA